MCCVVCCGLLLLVVLVFAVCCVLLDVLFGVENLLFAAQRVLRFLVLVAVCNIGACWLFFVVCCLLVVVCC